MTKERVIYLLSCESPEAVSVIFVKKEDAQKAFDDLSCQAIKRKLVFNAGIYEIPVNLIREEKSIKNPTLT